MVDGKTGEGQRGFTLAQMAMVVLLAGILMTMGVMTLRVLQENQGVSVTKKRLETIGEALRGYYDRYHRLPCPDRIDSLDGLEDCGEDPSQEVGVLPVYTLQLPRQLAWDGWQHYFTYRVDRKDNGWTSTDGFPSPRHGDIQVQIRDVHGRLLEPSPVQDGVAVVVSHGRNGFGAYTAKGTQIVVSRGADERQNAEVIDNNSLFVDRMPSDADSGPGGAFDDHLLVLRAGMFAAGGSFGRPIERDQGSMVSLRVAQVQDDLRLLNEAAFRLQEDLYHYADQFPRATEQPDDGIDSDADEDGQKETVSVFADPCNGPSGSACREVGGERIRASIGFDFLDGGGDKGEQTLAVLTLVQHGFVSPAYERDPWDRPYRWDRTSHQFFSEGAEAGCQGDGQGHWDEVTMHQYPVALPIGGGDLHCSGSR